MIGRHLTTSMRHSWPWPLAARAQTFVSAIRHHGVRCCRDECANRFLEQLFAKAGNPEWRRVRLVVGRRWLHTVPLPQCCPRTSGARADSHRREVVLIGATMKPTFKQDRPSSCAGGKAIRLRLPGRGHRLVRSVSSALPHPRRCGVPIVVRRSNLLLWLRHTSSPHLLYQRL